MSNPTSEQMRDAEDAARYRWLRDHHRSDGRMHRLEWYLPRGFPTTAEGLDKAIDEARRSD